MRRPTRQQIRRPRSRDGIAVIELAVCLPLLVLILMGTIESCRMIQLKQNLTVTAYEGARVGTVPGSTAGSVLTQCELLLTDRGISNYQIAMSQNPTTLKPGDDFTVTVSAGCDANSLVGAVFYQGRTLSESVVLRAQ